MNRDGGTHNEKTREMQEGMIWSGTELRGGLLVLWIVAELGERNLSVGSSVCKGTLNGCGSCMSHERVFRYPYNRLHFTYSRYVQVCYCACSV